MMFKVRAVAGLNGKFSILLFGLLSALAFPAVLMYGRYFIIESVPYIIFMQASTSFGAFIIQAGLRAGLRKEYVQGRLRLVQSASLAFINALILFGLPLSFISIFILDLGYTFLPTLASLNAALTMMLGLLSLKGNIKGVLVVSFFLMIINLSAGISELINYGGKLHYIFIEAISFILLVVTRKILSKSYRGGSYSVLWKVVLRYTGLQVTSFFILASIFLLSMSVVYLSEGNPRLSIIYADVTVASNILILLLGRGSLVFEKDILNGNVIKYLNSVFILAFVFACIFSFLREPGERVVAFLLTLSFIGQFTLSSLSQYAKESSRKIFVFFSGAFFIYYMLIAMSETDIFSKSTLLIFNLYSISMVVYLLLLRVKIGGFINAK